MKRSLWWSVLVMVMMMFLMAVPVTVAVPTSALATTQTAVNESTDVLSSDDSSNSEFEDHRLLIQEPEPHTSARHHRGRRRRAWVPSRDRGPYIAEDGEHAVRHNILRREHFVEQFMGDRGDEDEGHTGLNIRVATANVNKCTWSRMDEIKVWTFANSIDFLVLSDAGVRSTEERSVWSNTVAGVPAPALLLIGNQRVAIVMDKERWQSRWNKRSTVYSPAGRSLCASFRLGGNTELTLIGTYCPDTPHRHIEETRRERSWIEHQVQIAEQRGNICVVAGDFNIYPDEDHDRISTGQRDGAARTASDEFRVWTAETGIVSSFRHRHQTMTRFTYQNGATKSALDDIYISGRHSHLIRQSGIWMYSLNCSDHVGTPFVCLALDRTQRSSRHLRHVKAIKVIDVKNKSREDLREFSLAQEENLASGRMHLLAPLAEDESDPETIRKWLNEAIQNLYKCMYKTAKDLWGEKSQCQQSIDRAVSVKRTVRCSGQWRAVRRLQDYPRIDVAQLREAYARIQWPKWVIFPQRVPASSPHYLGAVELNQWRNKSPPTTIRGMQGWLNEGWELWQRVVRTRRNWRQRQHGKINRIRRKHWMSTGQIRRFLHATIKSQPPPVLIQGGLVGESPHFYYEETKDAVSAAMTDLLDNWIPPLEKTKEPTHLTAESVENERDLPQFIREWLLDDIKAGGTHREAFRGAGNEWGDFCYDEALQHQVDRMVNTGVAPGYGGIPQELWINAPPTIRERERMIFNVILRTGVVPEILNHRQMVFLPKNAVATGVWERQGLPPWRPITVQSSLATRLFTAISCYLEVRVPNHPMQHGFQRDKTVQDAALATTLLLDRAVQKKQPLYLLSKDCEKCYDRIPRWVMAYIYKRIGVPDLLYNILMGFLGEGEIDIRTAYGWIPSGKREFGLGQGSVLSIRHIGYYMDVLMQRQDNGPDPVIIRHTQNTEPHSIAATVLVDDVIDVATTRSGIEHRVDVSNTFTGIAGTGGVFGATKSFLMQYTPETRQVADTVYLQDGLGQPRAVTVVSPSEGFKHLGIFQGTDDIWSATLAPIWKALKRDEEIIGRLQLTHDQLQYIVNHVWLPRVQYRTQLNSSLKVARHVDTLVRRVAKKVLKLPHSTPSALFHDVTQGLGLNSFEDMCNVSRVQLCLRVMNSPHLSAYHLLVEAFELYQAQAGLPCHPLQLPLAPPSHLQRWIHQTIRAVVAIGTKVDVDWVNPPECRTTRPNDRSVWLELPKDVQDRLLRYNLKYPHKVRFVGDISNGSGALLVHPSILARQYRWTRKQLQEYVALDDDLRRALCTDGTRKLANPIGRLPIDTNRLQVHTLDIAPGQFFIASEFEVMEDGLELRGYELGQRVDDVVLTNPIGHGLEINVQWWHEPRRNSGVWSKRPGCIETELVDVCVPVDVTYLPTRGGRRANPRVIIWDDTSAGGITGRMSRDVIVEAFNRSSRNYDEVMTTGEVRLVNRSCTLCCRRRGSTFCETCGEWHHSNCKMCHIAPVRPIRDEWAVCCEVSMEEQRIAAGDGSVINAGTTNARGGWGLRTGSVRRLGKVNVHRADITSTRCELHAIISGLAVSQDSGDQVCDNQAAIGILQQARAIVNGSRPSHIKYGNRHRVEIRSMVALMRPGGSFRLQWVRSHQEHEPTSNSFLTAQRDALAAVDGDASRSHGHTMVNSYSDILRWDAAHLIDSEGAPVVGRTQTYLALTAAAKRKLEWIDRQRARGDARETACATEVNMVKILGWNEYQKRFYWRSIANILPTNSRKHSLHSEWDPKCRLCEEPRQDTQSHRYGTCGDPCGLTMQLYVEINDRVERVCAQLWLPDQEWLIPGQAHRIAVESGKETRSWWSFQDQGSGPWKVMVRLSLTMWAHATQVTRLIQGWRWAQYASHLFVIEAGLCRSRPAGRLLPAQLQRAVHACHPGAAHLNYHPSQASGLWASGTLHPRYPKHIEALACSEPNPDHAVWWLDDIFIPSDESTLARVRAVYDRATSPHKALWVACYDNTKAHVMAKEMNAEWFICIPQEAIHMRTRQAVSQTSATTRRAITSKNPLAIWIGIISPPTTHAQHHHWAEEWAVVLQHGLSMEWLLVEKTSEVPTAYGTRQALITWHTSLATTGSDPVLAHNRHWLETEFPALYTAPSGWKMWPSATHVTMQWAQALMVTVSGATKLHHGVLRALWAANRNYWNITCRENIQAINVREERGLLQEVNGVIQQGRRRHARAPMRLDKMLEQHLATSRRRADTWHEDRRRQLDSATQDA